MSLFNTGKPNKRKADIISIKSPEAFRQSINRLKEGYFTTSEKRSLILAQNRAGALAKRKDISSKEKKQLMKIKEMKI